MTYEEQLEAHAGDLESRAAAVRVTLNELRTLREAGAKAGLSTKLRQASQLRAEVNGNGTGTKKHGGARPKNNKRHKGHFGETVMSFLVGHGPATTEQIREHLINTVGSGDLRGMGNLARYKMVTLKNGLYHVGKRNGNGQPATNGTGQAIPGFELHTKGKHMTLKARKRLPVYAAALAAKTAGTTVTQQQILSALREQGIKAGPTLLAAAVRRGYLEQAPGSTRKLRTYSFVLLPEAPDLTA